MAALDEHLSVSVLKEGYSETAADAAVSVKAGANRYRKEAIGDIV